MKITNYKLQILNTKILTSFAGKILSISGANANEISSLIKGKGILRENR